MRFLHQDAKQIIEYVESCRLTVSKCDFAGAAMATPVDAHAIADMLKRSGTLWGTALPYYLRVSKSDDVVAVGLVQAVKQVEASGREDEFLIVAYQDGGLISVSSVVLAFQSGARTAEWWAPYKSASRG